MPEEHATLSLVSLTAYHLQLHAAHVLALRGQLVNGASEY